MALNVGTNNARATEMSRLMANLNTHPRTTKGTSQTVKRRTKADQTRFTSKSGRAVGNISRRNNQPKSKIVGTSKAKEEPLTVQQTPLSRSKEKKFSDTDALLFRKSIRTFLDTVKTDFSLTELTEFVSNEAKGVFATRTNPKQELAKQDVRQVEAAVHLVLLTEQQSAKTVEMTDSVSMVPSDLSAGNSDIQPQAVPQKEMALGSDQSLMETDNKTETVVENAAGGTKSADITTCLNEQGSSLLVSESAKHNIVAEQEENVIHGGKTADPLVLLTVQDSDNTNEIADSTLIVPLELSASNDDIHPQLVEEVNFYSDESAVETEDNAKVVVENATDQTKSDETATILTEQDTSFSASSPEIAIL